MASGKFDHLELAGVPVDLTDYFNLPPELRMAWTILRNANCVPVEVALAREIETLREQCANCATDEEKRRLDRVVRDKEAALRQMMERSAGARR